MAEESFKFPDEISNKEVPQEVEIEVVNDTPPVDRGREALPQNIVEELEKDDLEEYSDKVKKRLGQMKKVWHDERREKESAQREREEALRFAQSRDSENRQLKQRLGQGEKLFVAEITKSASTDVLAAKAKLKQAYEAGDSEAIADAQEAMTDAKLKLREYEQYRPSLQTESSGVEPQRQTQAPPQAVDHKAESWRVKNTWFGADEEMTSLALGLHEKLVRSGVDPRSDDYYHRVDETMRKRFPENFEEDQSQSRGNTPRKPATVVAPATRSTAPRKVQLTQTQLALARKFNLSPEAYAREVIKLENNNG